MDDLQVEVGGKRKGCAVKKLPALVLVAIALTACARRAAPAGEGFAIYLLSGKLSPAEVAQADLRTLELADKPILSTEDIVTYARQTHEIRLTAAAVERIGQLEVPVSAAGLPFVVCVDKEPIYSGAFWSALSCWSFDGVVIMTLPGVLPGAQRGYIRIEASFSGERADPRSDPRILRALEAAGKLRDDGTLASTPPAQAQRLAPERMSRLFDTASSSDRALQCPPHAATNARSTSCGSSMKTKRLTW